MQLSIYSLALIAVLAPAVGGVIAGIGGRRIGDAGAHWVTILLMVVSFAASLGLVDAVVLHGQTFNGTVYTWAVSGNYHFEVGFLLDKLSVMMMVMVTFVSLVVHIYSVGYMKGDSGYPRFFSYVSLFTFAMLTLVVANNFLQLFFGWEGVGVISYLLIGFWFHKESAAVGSLKAFIVNRIGDCGFILGIAAIFDYFGSLSYGAVFAGAPQLAHTTISILPGTHVGLITLICVLLFIGAMAKSAQVPLHVWLPESMEGPTPISALIHAATMVTAGVYMVARMSPLFELSQPALTMVLVFGATGALFLGFLAFVEYDIKRVIAYSTMSQLGYMMAANGASAFSAGIFHLMTHACFKALLFLAAGSVIMGMNHEQDLRKMGGLRKYMPITYATFLIGALALAAIPPFAGFYSKDAIIEAVHHASIPGAGYAYACLLIGSFVTGYYIFRAFFLAFHTKEKMPESLRSQIKESPWTITVPLILLAIPSIFLGEVLIHGILYQVPGFLGTSIYVLPKYNVLAQMGQQFHGVWQEALHAVNTLPFWFSATGIAAAWFTCIAKPAIREDLQRWFAPVYRVLVAKYGFDTFNDRVITRGVRATSEFFFQTGDEKLLDHYVVNGIGRGITRLSAWMRKLQSGYLYHYVLVMMIGLLALLLWRLY